MTERSNVEIDYCPTCRGVWLDRGELDKIIEKSNSFKPDESANNRVKVQEVIYRNDSSDKDHYNKHKRKKSFLEDLFD
jgi:hypothetical protein